MSPTSTASSVRERLLDAAARLMYAEGIQAIGVDRLIAEANISKASFYRHFASKDQLVCAYLEARDCTIRATVDQVLADVDPADVVTALVAGLGFEICSPGFRGCPFINAAAEYPDPEHPVRLVIDRHRRWFHDVLAGALGAGGHPHAAATAAALVMLRDGAMVGGYLDDVQQVSDGLARAAVLVITAAAADAR